ncbi:hypothetical protein BDA96_02G235600 [Sorghum bicolor]|jgi:acetyl esterase/lipase|uniref:Alpha/beta hydrolase fold-3 domain-containing protein n=1 Tax=Sorghum bicolor TaxID=4558 RepID=A0A921RPU3_SORBI|nr:hypothetical protein BDA96_02G235600 [Sorghum bicolor]
MDSSSAEVIFESLFFRLFSDGHVERTGGMDTVPAGFDADTGVISKDVVIDAATGVAARLYLPSIQTVRTPSTSDGGCTAKKLPVLVVFHGGFFILGSSRDPNFHRYMNWLVASARVVAVSVDYRLAPEHPLPAAYDDSWAALNWAVSGAADPWLSDHGDLGRVFVAGASAGANIAHNMAVAAAGMNGLQAAPRLEGVILLHPSFCGEQRMEDEAEEFLEANKKRWAVIFPGASNGSDDPRINPMAAGAGAPGLARLAGKKLFVSTASEDARAPRGRAYCDAVRTGGWTGKLQWFESEGKGHCFFVHDYGSHEAVALMDQVVAFIAG